MKPHLPKQAPRFYGSHPALKKQYYREMSEGKVPFAIQNRIVQPLSAFHDARHPSVYLIPRDKDILVVDDQFHDPIGLFEHQIWFSSHNVFINTESDDYFKELDNERDPFWRMGGIPQLGYLIHPFPERYPNVSISVVPPTFPHTRWIHCRLAAAMAEVILGRNGFSQAERAPFILTTAFHDIAMPAGGDSVKRIDPNELDEEKNFLYALELWNLIPRWNKEYGFDPEKAASWVRNEGTLGLFLDVLDKISYVSLDTYYLALQIEGQLRTLCLNHPLYMDVWQDIVFTTDKSRFAFTNPDRLYTFLLARAYEHQQLLMNPWGRPLDFFLTNLVKPLFDKGVITKKDLMLWSTERLHAELTRYYPPQSVTPYIFTPEEYGWKELPSQEALDAYVTENKERVYCKEHLKGFKPGLDLPVYADKRKTAIVPLRSLLPKHRIQRLIDIVDSCKGYFAYWHKPLDS